MRLTNKFISKRILKGLLKSNEITKKDDVTIRKIEIDLGWGDTGIVIVSINGTNKTFRYLIDYKSKYGAKKYKKYAVIQRILKSEPGLLDFSGLVDKSYIDKNCTEEKKLTEEQIKGRIKKGFFRIYSSLLPDTCIISVEEKINKSLVDKLEGKVELSILGISREDNSEFEYFIKKDANGEYKDYAELKHIPSVPKKVDIDIDDKMIEECNKTRKLGYIGGLNYASNLALEDAKDLFVDGHDRKAELFRLFSSRLKIKAQKEKEEFDKKYPKG